MKDTGRPRRLWILPALILSLVFPALAAAAMYGGGAFAAVPAVFGTYRHGDYVLVSQTAGAVSTEESEDAAPPPASMEEGTQATGEGAEGAAGAAPEPPLTGAEDVIGEEVIGVEEEEPPPPIDAGAGAGEAAAGTGEEPAGAAPDAAGAVSPPDEKAGPAQTGVEAGEPAAEPSAGEGEEPVAEEGGYAGPIDVRLRYLYGFNAQLSGKPLSWVDKIVIEETHGEIYLLDRGNSRIVIMDIKGGYLYHFDYTLAGVKSPLTMDVDGETGEIYVADGKRVAVLDYRGEFLRNVDLSGVPGHDEMKMQSIALYRDGEGQKLYIGDAEARRVIVLGAEGRFIRQYTDKVKISMNIGDLNVIRGRMLWLDPGRFAVFILSEDGRDIKAFGKVSSLLGGFSMPSDLAVDERQGRIIVVDGNRMMVVVFDMDGNVLFEFGGPLVFSWPRAVAVDSEGRIYVADNSGIIRVFEAVPVSD